MIIRRYPLSMWAMLLALATGLSCGASLAQAPQGVQDSDPPVRVGRLADLAGEVSFSPAGNDEWVHARVNRPVVTGDKLWADNNARAELAVDNSTWWLGSQTSVVVTNLDDRIVQLSLQQGTLDVRVRRFAEGNIVEVDTPNLAFSITRPGRYRVEVDPQDGTTSVVVRSGTGEVYGENASYVIASGQGYRFYGNDLSDSEFIALPRADAFDRWVSDRDRRYDRVASVRYVSPEVIGYEDLDSYGSWSVVSDYGGVWFPRRVRAGWAPYRDGHWAWIDPWGWTWVDDEPWGFAPFHYGRWAYFDRGWGWIPGPRSVQPVYAPALVAFVGGAGFSIAVSSGPAIGWFPLGPREVYVPPYSVSRNYFRQVNVSNTVVNVTNITNIYNNPTQVTQINYVNRGAPNAVTAVAPAAFAQSQSVSRAAIAMPAAAVQRAEVRAVAPVAPARTSFLGAAPAAQARPPAAVVQRAVVAKAAPPPPPVSDAAKLQALEKNPGRPLNRAELQTLQRATPPATAAAQPQVKVVEQPKPAANAAPPARAAGPAGSRQAGGPPGVPAAVGTTPPAGAPPAASGTPPGATPPAAAVRPGGEAPGRAGPPGRPSPAERAARPGAEPQQPEAKGPPAAGPPQAQRVPGAPGRPAAPPSAAEERRGGPPERAGAARGPAERAAPEQAPPQSPSVARPPSAPGAGRPGVGRPESFGRPESAPPGQMARPPESRAPGLPPRGPEERAAPQPQRPPEARSQPQRAPEERAAPQRLPEARPQPPRPPEARPQPQRGPEERAAPQRAPEARPQPQPQRPPEARPQPQPQRPPEARPQPQPQPQRPPEARPQPQPQPQARGGPPPGQPERPQRPERPDEKGKGKAKDEGQ